MFSALVLVFGRPLYRALGGEGGSLEAALRYSNVVFAGTALVWLMNALASVIRGTGNMFVPALAICVGVVLLVPLSPCLIFGLGPFPALGIAGGGVAVVFTTALTASVLGWYILSGRSLVRLRLARLRWALFRDILRVGAVGSVSTLQTTLTVALTTALVGAAAGPDAIAGYGTGGAARIPADAAGVRPRRAAGRAGRHQHRRRPAGARAAHRADRRRARVRADRGDRPRRRDLAARLARAVRPRSAHAGDRHGVSARRSGRPTASSASACRCISPRRARAGCSGRCSRGCCAC